MQGTVRLRSTSSILCLSLTLCVLLGCGEDNPIDVIDESGSIEASIGPEGGSVSVTDAAHELFGVHLAIPESALVTTTTLGLSSRSMELSPPNGLSPSGTCISLEPQDLCFAVPASLTVPCFGDSLDLESTFLYRLNPGGENWLPTEKAHPASKSTELIALITQGGIFQAFGQTGAPPPPEECSVTGFSVNTAKLVPPTPTFCYGDCAFVLWYWGTKSQDGHTELVSWRPAHHATIAEYSHGTTWRENRDRSSAQFSTDDLSIANQLKTGICQNRPQLLLIFLDGAPLGHTLIVYAYSTPGDQLVAFDVYDPNAADKYNILLLSNGEFSLAPWIPHPEGGEVYYSVYQTVEMYPPSLDFVYEYFLEKPNVSDRSPEGQIFENPLQMSARVRYPYLDPDLLVVELDGGSIPLTSVEMESPHVALVTGALPHNLSSGEHTFTGDASNASRECDPQDPNDDIPHLEESWDFHLWPELGSTEWIVGSYRLDFNIQRAVWRKTFDDVVTLSFWQEEFDPHVFPGAGVSIDNGSQIAVDVALIPTEIDIVIDVEGRVAYSYDQVSGELRNLNPCYVEFSKYEILGDYTGIVSGIIYGSVYWYPMQEYETPIYARFEDVTLYYF